MTPKLQAYIDRRTKKLADTVAERFWAKVKKGNKDECWPWTGCKTRIGYGHIEYLGKSMNAHRQAWCLTFGPIEKGSTFVLHQCDNPLCCNPNHLFLGSQKDNMRDMLKKGRGRKWKHMASRRKLTESQVKEIRQKYQPGKNGNKPGNAKQLSMDYGISRCTVCQITRGDSWKHLKGTIVQGRQFKSIL